MGLGFEGCKGALLFGIDNLEFGVCIEAHTVCKNPPFEARFRDSGVWGCQASGLMFSWFGRS